MLGEARVPLFCIFEQGPGILCSFVHKWLEWRPDGAVRNHVKFLIGVVRVVYGLFEWPLR